MQWGDEDVAASRIGRLIAVVLVVGGQIAAITFIALALGWIRL